MHARHRLLAAAALALPFAIALAQQPHIRPGLWEETLKLKTDDPKANAAMEQMQQRLAAMPPDQRAAIEKMMASHGLGMGANGNTLRVCITKEQIARGFHPEDKGRCSRTKVSNSGNVTSFDFACQNERDSITGHGTFTEMGDTAFAVTTVADTVTQKETRHMESNIAGKFVSSDCGDVKPMEMPPAK